MPDIPDSPWLAAKDAAAHASVSVRTLYAAVERGHVRAARIGSGRCLRFRREWIDAWLEASATPVEITKDRRWG